MRRPDRCWLLLTHAFAGSTLVHDDLRVEGWSAAHRTPTGNAVTRAGTSIAEAYTVAALWVAAMLVAWRVVATAFAIGAPIIVGFSRMYRGFHYPTDVVAGALLGVVWLTTTYHLLLKPLLATRRPETSVEHDEPALPRPPPRDLSR